MTGLTIEDRLRRVELRISEQDIIMREEIEKINRKIGYLAIFFVVCFLLLLSLVLFQDAAINDTVDRIDFNLLIVKKMIMDGY